MPSEPTNLPDEDENATSLVHRRIITVQTEQSSSDSNKDPMDGWLEITVVAEPRIEPTESVIPEQNYTDDSGPVSSNSLSKQLVIPCIPNRSVIESSNTFFAQLSQSTSKQTLNSNKDSSFVRVTTPGKSPTNKPMIVSPKEVYALPKASRNKNITKKTHRKKGNTVILTSTPEKKIGG